MLRQCCHYNGRRYRGARNQVDYRKTWPLHTLYSCSSAMVCIPPIRELISFCFLSGNHKFTYSRALEERRDIGSNCSADEEECNEAKDSYELKRYQLQLYRQPAVKETRCTFIVYRQERRRCGCES